MKKFCHLQDVNFSNFWNVKSLFQKYFFNFPNPKRFIKFLLLDIILTYYFNKQWKIYNNYWKIDLERSIVLFLPIFNNTFQLYHLKLEQKKWNVRIFRNQICPNQFFHLKIIPIFLFVQILLNFFFLQQLLSLHNKKKYSYKFHICNLYSINEWMISLSELITPVY